MLKTKIKAIILSCIGLIYINQCFSQTLTNDQLRDSINSILDESNTPSAFVRVVTKDTILFQSEFGTGDAAQKIKLQKEGLFALGSISKTITALGIMKLVGEGKLSLEDELKEVAPEIPFTNKWEATHPIKIKDLLSHRSGFDDMHISDIIKKRTSKMSALEEAMTYEKSYHSNWKPGLVYSYSNPGYVVLGFIIEKVSGNSYQQFISNNILAPLQMDNTYYYSTNTTSAFLQGFQRSKDGIEPSEKPTLIGEAAGGMISNGDDIARLLQFFLNDGKIDSIEIIASNLIERMEQLQSDFEITNNIETGYSMGMRDKYRGEKDLLFKAHNGSINGFTSDYIFSRTHDLGIAISINLFQKSTYQIVNLLVDQFAETNNVKTAEKAAEEIDISDFTQWEGTYKMLNGTNEIVNFINVPFRTIKLSIERDKIHLKRFMKDTEIYDLKYHNAFSDSNGFTSLFLCKSDEEEVLVFYEDSFVKINPFVHFIMLCLLVFGLVSGTVITLLSASQLLIFPFKKTILNSLKTSFLMGLPFWLIVGSVTIYLSTSSFLNLETLGTLTFTSISIFMLSALYPFCNIYSGYILIRRQAFFKNRSRKIIHNILFAGVTFFSMYCLYHGWFALSLWRY